MTQSHRSDLCSPPTPTSRRSLMSGGHATWRRQATNQEMAKKTSVSVEPVQAPPKFSEFLRKKALPKKSKKKPACLEQVLSVEPAPACRVLAIPLPWRPPAESDSNATAGKNPPPSSQGREQEPERTNNIHWICDFCLHGNLECSSPCSLCGKERGSRWKDKVNA